MPQENNRWWKVQGIIVGFLSSILVGLVGYIGVLGITVLQDISVKMDGFLYESAATNNALSITNIVVKNIKEEQIEQKESQKEYQAIVTEQINHILGTQKILTHNGGVVCDGFEAYAQQMGWTQSNHKCRPMKD